MTRECSRSSPASPIHYQNNASTTTRPRSQSSRRRPKPKAEISPHGVKKLRKRVPVACVPCNRAKTSCSGSRPCLRCLGRGISTECIDVVHRKKGRPKKIRESFPPRVLDGDGQEIKSSSTSPKSDLSNSGSPRNLHTSPRHQKLSSPRSLHQIANSNSPRHSSKSPRHAISPRHRQLHSSPRHRPASPRLAAPPQQRLRPQEVLHEFPAPNAPKTREHANSNESGTSDTSIDSLISLTSSALSNCTVSEDLPNECAEETSPITFSHLDLGNSLSNVLSSPCSSPTSLSTFVAQHSRPETTSALRMFKQTLTRVWAKLWTVERLSKFIDNRTVSPRVHFAFSLVTTVMDPEETESLKRHLFKLFRSLGFTPPVHFEVFTYDLEIDRLPFQDNLPIASISIVFSKIQFTRIEARMSFSHYAERLFGYSTGEVERMTEDAKGRSSVLPFFWRLFAPEDWAMLIEVEQLACCGAQFECTRSIRIVTKTGKQIPCSISIRYRSDFDGVFTNAVYCVIPSSGGFPVHIPSMIGGSSSIDIQMSDAGQLPQPFAPLFDIPFKADL